MTSVIRACKGADIRFGDFKSAVPQSGFTKVPDIAVMDSKARLLLVGEAKTPWIHNIEGSIQEAPGDFRRYLGQIARYVYLTQSKYGFLTTYEQTIFLKQDKHPTRKGRWVLWHSPVILHDTQSRRVPGPSGRGQDLSNPALYRQRVSLRECFLYFIDLACGEKTAMNTMKLNTWVVGQDFKFDQHDYVSDESPSSSSEEDSSKPYSAQRGDISTSRASTHKQAQESASMADLESLMLD
ncbi:hypothetical protein VTN02DRAFT_2079 [Thermoascus thermophilus]